MITALDKNTALMLIDLQNAIVTIPLAHPVKDVLNNVNLLIEDATQPKHNRENAAWDKNFL